MEGAKTTWFIFKWDLLRNAIKNIFFFFFSWKQMKIVLKRTKGVRSIPAIQYICLMMRMSEHSSSYPPIFTCCSLLSFSSLTFSFLVSRQSHSSIFHVVTIWLFYLPSFCFLPDVDILLTFEARSAHSPWSWTEETTAGGARRVVDGDMCRGRQGAQKPSPSQSLGMLFSIKLLI